MIYAYNIAYSCTDKFLNWTLWIMYFNNYTVYAWSESGSSSKGRCLAWLTLMTGLGYMSSTAIFLIMYWHIMRFQAQDMFPYLSYYIVISQFLQRPQKATSREPAYSQAL